MKNARLKNNYFVTTNLTEIALKMAQAARAGVAIEKKRLQEILAELQREPASPPR